MTSLQEELTHKIRNHPEKLMDIIRKLLYLYKEVKVLRYKDTQQSLLKLDRIINQIFLLRQISESDIPLDQYQIRIAHLERMKQMELDAQKSLGSYLAESDSVDDKLVEMMDEQVLRSSYLKNIPSLIPVSGVITQTMINDNSGDIRKHYGIDIAVPVGEPILASASGQIVFSGWTTEFGNLVVIYHNNEYFTYYGHNELILVNTYEKVERGDVIATSGNSGISSGPHLHFEIWKDGVAVDPLSYFPELNKLNISVE